MIYPTQTSRNALMGSFAHVGHKEASILELRLFHNQL